MSKEYLVQCHGNEVLEMKLQLKADEIEGIFTQNVNNSTLTGNKMLIDYKEIADYQNKIISGTLSSFVWLPHKAIIFPNSICSLTEDKFITGYFTVIGGSGNLHVFQFESEKLRDDFRSDLLRRIKEKFPSFAIV